jgi:hypothetical protein
VGNVQVHIPGGDDAAEVLVDVFQVQAGHKKPTAIPRRARDGFKGI